MLPPASGTFTDAFVSDHMSRHHVIFLRGKILLFVKTGCNKHEFRY